MQSQSKLFRWQKKTPLCLSLREYVCVSLLLHNYERTCADAIVHRVHCIVHAQSVQRRISMKNESWPWHGNFVKPTGECVLTFTSQFHFRVLLRIVYGASIHGIHGPICSGSKLSCSLLYCAGGYFLARRYAYVADAAVSLFMWFVFQRHLDYSCFRCDFNYLRAFSKFALVDTRMRQWLKRIHFSISLKQTRNCIRY